MIKGLPLTSSTWDEKEIVAAKRVLDSGNTTMGLEVAEFEAEFAQATKIIKITYTNTFK